LRYTEAIEYQKGFLLMKTLKLSITVVAVFLAAVGLMPSAQANGQLDQILTNMQNAGKGINTLAGNIAQRKKSSLGGKDEVYQGTTTLQRGAKGSEKVIVHYTNGQHVSVVGNKIVLYNERIPQAIETTRQSQANSKPEFDFIATPYSSVADLKARFNIAYLGDENGMAKLELTPKNPALPKSILWVDKGLWIPTQFRVVEKTGDISYFTLSNVQLNPKVSAETFRIKYAPGTQILKR
jgi:outer membrane lipoprotein-sorting protein